MGSGENEGFSSGTSQGADSRLAIGHPCRDLRGLSGQANPGIWRRGPGCALGGKASREGQDVPTKWEPRQECGCHPGGHAQGCLSSGGRRWQHGGLGGLDQHSCTEPWGGRGGLEAAGGDGYFQVLGPSGYRSEAATGHCGVRWENPLLPSLLFPPSPFSSPPSLLSFLFLVRRTGPINTYLNADREVPALWHFW